MFRNETKSLLLYFCGRHRKLLLMLLNFVYKSSTRIMWASRPKFTILWGHVEEVLLLNNFFRLSIGLRALVAKIWPDKFARLCRDGDFLRPVFTASRVQHVSDLHSKFALRPHHVSKYGRHPICDVWDQARKKDRRKKKETTGQKYNAPRYIGRPYDAVAKVLW